MAIYDFMIASGPTATIANGTSATAVANGCVRGSRFNREVRMSLIVLHRHSFQRILLLTRLPQCHTLPSHTRSANGKILLRVFTFKWIVNVSSSFSRWTTRIHFRWWCMVLTLKLQMLNGWPIMFRRVKWVGDWFQWSIGHDSYYIQSKVKWPSTDGVSVNTELDGFRISPNFDHTISLQSIENVNEVNECSDGLAGWPFIWSNGFHHCWIVHSSFAGQPIDLSVAAVARDI